MSQSDQPRWIWSQEAQQYFYYEANSDSLVFQDGRRVARPPHVPRTAFTSATAATPSSSSHAANPLPPNPNYVTGAAGSQHKSQAPRSAGPQAPAAGPSRTQHGYPDPTRRSSSQVDALAQNLSGVTISTQYPQPGQSGHPQPVTPQVRVGRDGQRIVETADPTTHIRTIIQTAPATAITDPALLQSGIVARSRLLPSDNEVYERLFRSFRLRDQPRKFFTVGKVFHVLWVEPAGESNTQVTGLEVGTTIGRFGERAFSKVRRFVVVREGDNYCSALPITSYGHRGVGKPGVNKSEHSIIHTTKDPPEPLSAELPTRGEEGMRPHAIRVDSDDPVDKLDALSRLDYGKVHTIQHNIKVKAFGKVHPKSMFALINQFGNVWHTLPAPAQASTSRDVADVEQPSYSIQDSTATQHRPSHTARVSSGGASLQSLPAPSITQARASMAARQPSGAGGELSAAERAALLQADVRAAVQRLVQQGHSEEQAQRAIREELARRQQQAEEAARRRASQEEDEESSSDDDDDADRRGQRGGQRRESFQQQSAQQQQAGSGQTRSGAHSSSQTQERSTTQTRSAAGTQSYSSTGAQPSSSRTAAGAQSAAARGTGQSQSQARSTGASTSSQAQAQANRAQVEALMAQLLRDGRTRDEALAIIRQRFGSARP